MADVSVIPVSGDPWGSGAVPLAISLAASNTSGNALRQWDEMPAGSTPVGRAITSAAPVAQAIGSSLVSGHAADDLRGWISTNYPDGTGALRAAALTPAMLAAHAADGATSGPHLFGDVASGALDPLSREGIERGFTAVSSLAAPGLAGAEEGAAGAMGGRLSLAHENGQPPPQGWYLHGRAPGTGLNPDGSLNFDYPRQMTRMPEIAQQYAGQTNPDGSVWAMKPNKNATVLDFTHDETPDYERVGKIFEKHWDNGTFPDHLVDIDPNLSGAEAWPHVGKEFTPQKIVDHAGAFDSPGLSEWLYDWTGADFIHTPDGAVALTGANTKKIKINRDDMLYSRAIPGSSGILSSSLGPVPAPRSSLFDQIFMQDFAAHRAT